MKKTNIQHIAENAICCGCGSCVAICPQKSITIKRNEAGFLTPTINDTCVNCKKCLEVCPSHPENTFKNLPKNILIGDYQCAYIGYSSSEETRKVGQSGGVVSGLVQYLLDSNKIDGAVLTKFDSKNQEPIAHFAQTRDEVIKSAGSYYSQASTCKTILENKDKKMAAVVLGCHSESLQLQYEKFNIPKPEYTIGLVCAGQNSNRLLTDLIDLIEQKHAIKIAPPFYFRYRDKQAGGWPGKVAVSKDGKNYSIETINRFKLKPVYESHRCITCYDQMSIFSDIVCGDPWGISENEQQKGNTVILVRTNRGAELIQNAQAAGFINIKKIDPKDIIKGQTVENRHKNKVNIAHSYFEKENWLYPYNQQVISNFTSSNPITEKEESAVIKRLKYTREFVLAETSENISNISVKKKQEIEYEYKQNNRLIVKVTRPIKKILKKTILLIKK